MKREDIKLGKVYFVKEDYTWGRALFIPLKDDGAITGMVIASELDDEKQGADAWREIESGVEIDGWCYLPSEFICEAEGVEY